MRTVYSNRGVSYAIAHILTEPARICTAIHQIMVHADVAEDFVAKFTAKVGSLKLGLPWEDKVDLTPLPEPAKPQYLRDLCADAESKGATIISPGASQDWGHTAVFPSIAYPVTAEMRVMQEEQFGPLIPIAKFNTLATSSNMSLLLLACLSIIVPGMLESLHDISDANELHLSRLIAVLLLLIYMVGPPSVCVHTMNSRGLSTHRHTQL